MRALLGLCCLWMALPAFAQDADLTLYVFNRGLPEPGIEVLVDGRLATVTDENGLALLDVPPGLRQLELREQDLVVFDQQVLLTAGEVAQWIVNITRGGGALVDVESTGEAPGVAAEETEAEVAAGPPGRLLGRLVNADAGEPIAGARVFLSGLSRDIRTGDDGRFEVELPPGSYSLSVLHSGFNTVTRDEIEIAPEAETPLELELTPSGSELPEFVVIEPYIAGSLASVLEERRTEVAVANILGAEQISKAGDSDAAGALKRVTGLTLVGGRFIYVRGLGERYSSTILNGADVPSPDPTRRVVPLDLFPTSIIDSIAVQKGFTPEMPGEFGGGSVQLRTRALPESAFFTAEFSMGYNDQTTFKDGLTYDGGGRDWTGFDDGTRDPSRELVDATGDGTRLAEFNRFTGEGFTPEELEVIGESLPVNYDAESDEPPPNLGFSLGGGNVFDIGEKWRVGFLAALEYGNDWNTASQVRIDYINAGGGVLEEESRFVFDATFNEIDLAGFFTAGVEYGDLHTLSYNWMLLRNTTNRTQVEQGTSPDAPGGEVRFTELEWFEREMNANQLIGSHVFPFAWDLKLEWQYTTATANSSVPDTRRYRYDPDRLTPEEDDFIFSLRNDSNQRRWSDLEDNSDNWRVDLVQPIPLPFFDTIDLALTGGVSNVEKDRDSSIRRFAFQPEGAIARDSDLRRNPSVEDIIFDETIDPNGWQLQEVTIITDAYTASQVIDAWYVGLDLQAGEWLRLAGGIRQETSDQDVTTFDIFSPDRNPVVSDLTTDDRLPAATATFFFGDHQLRAGYGETLNRPDFKELSPAFYKDPILDRLVVGNPDLEAAFITHYDVRWDYYFNPGEFISLGAFYKEFDQPIEQVILAGAEKLVSFDNAESAENIGVEFEFYKSLDFVDDWWDWGDWWERLYVNTNYAWIDSEITLSDEDSSIQTSDTRPLQGQSPYVWNFQLGYDDEEREINTALVFNIFGERIVDVGILGTPDIYEEPRPSLDFVYKQGFGDWTVKFKFQNILDPDIELTQGGELKRLTKAGRELSLGIEWRPR